MAYWGGGGAGGWSGSRFSGDVATAAERAAGAHPAVPLHGAKNPRPAGTLQEGGATAVVRLLSAHRGLQRNADRAVPERLGPRDDASEGGAVCAGVQLPAAALHPPVPSGSATQAGVGAPVHVLAQPPLQSEHPTRNQGAWF